MQEVYIYDAVRTPRGRGKAGGALNEIKPTALAAGLLDALKERNGLDTSRVDDVVLGCVSPVLDQGFDIGRGAVLLSSWDHAVPGVQVDRFCASGLEAVQQAAQRIRSGWDQLIVAGGVDSMSRVPMGASGGWPFDPASAMTTGFVPQGISADLIATLEGVTRDEADAYSVESHRRATRAWDEGRFAKSIVPVKDMNGITVLERDELPRADANPETMAGLRPSFADQGAIGFDVVAQLKYPEVERVEHIHTAGNSSGIADGAALVLLGSEAMGRELGLKPRGRIVSIARVGTEPTIMLTGPTPASEKALAVAGLSTGDVDLFEVNEAFAIVPIQLMRNMGVQHDRINVNGGAIAMGHPLGATGAILVGTVLDELERQDMRYGLCTLCVGGGMGNTVVVERVTGFVNGEAK
jgi:acetyl-CoA C-acetyltransferase